MDILEANWSIKKHLFCLWIFYVCMKINSLWLSLNFEFRFIVIWFVDTKTSFSKLQIIIFLLVTSEEKLGLSLNVGCILPQNTGNLRTDKYSQKQLKVEKSNTNFLNRFWEQNFCLFMNSKKRKIQIDDKQQYNNVCKTYVI